MKTLKESLLGDIESNFAKGEDVMNALNTFGHKFKLIRAVCGSNSAGVLNMVNLKKLTKDLDYTDDNIKNGYFDKQGKIKMFANWLGHISFSDIGITNTNNTGDEFRRAFTEGFRKYCDDNNVFNSSRKVDMWATSVAVTRDADILDIIVTRNDNISNAYTFRLYYRAV